MRREEFLDRLADIAVWRRGGQRAPHKPLLLLLALGRRQQGAARLASYEHAIAGPLENLLRRFGPPRKAHHPDHPFGRLVNDGLWDIPGSEDLRRTSWGDLLVSDLRQRQVRGGLPEGVDALLRSEPELVEEAASRLLAAHFPESYHAAIRAAVGLAEPPAAAERTGVWKTRPRDPGFREAVLVAYERRCAVCDFDLRLGDDLLGLEAAHIKWRAAGGPDEVQNGLALCTEDHRALDRGAIGLEPRGPSGYALLVSRELTGRSEAFRRLVESSGRPLRPAQSGCDQPDPAFVAWHQREVFRGDPRR